MTKRMAVVGPVYQWQNMQRALPDVDGITFVDFSDLPETDFGRDPPDIVVSALVGPTYDVLDVARTLVSLGFHGAYRAVTTSLPSPNVVLAEVKAIAPELDFDIYVLSADAMT